MSNQPERDRLNQRIRTLSKPMARKLKAYRQRISALGAINKRRAAMVYVPKGDSGFLEGADVIELCHKFLDQHEIESNIQA